MALMALEQMQEDYENEELDLIDKIEKVLQNDAEQERVKRLKNRHLTLVSPLAPVEGDSDMAVYERCVRLAFTFEFGQLNGALKAWHPSEDFIMKKLMLLSLVDGKAIDGSQVL